MQCTATRKRSGQCTAQAVSGSQFCFHHNPTLQAAQHQARVKGGKNRKRTTASSALPRNIDLKTHGGLLEAGELIIRDGWENAEHGIGWVRAMASIFRSQNEAVKNSVLENRVNEIAAALKAKGIL